jgi:hypothetical protein
VKLPYFVVLFLVVTNDIRYSCGRLSMMWLVIAAIYSNEQLLIYSELRTVG